MTQLEGSPRGLRVLSLQHVKLCLAVAMCKAEYRTRMQTADLRHKRTRSYSTAEGRRERNVPNINSGFKAQTQVGHERNVPNINSGFKAQTHEILQYGGR
jgi:hypothetical protein